MGIPLRALRACSFYPPAAPCALFSDKRQASQCSQETRDEESHFAFISFHIIFIGSILAQHWGCREAKLPQTLCYGRFPVGGALVETTPRLVEVEMAEWIIDLVRCVRQVKVPRALTRGP